MANIQLLFIVDARCIQKKWTLKVGKGITKKKRSDDRSFIRGPGGPPSDQRERFRVSEIKEGRKKDHKKRAVNRPLLFVILGGFEPPTSCLSSKRSKPTELKDQYFAKGVAKIILFYCICKGIQRRDIRLFHSALDGDHGLNYLDARH